jgi:hypothetical protein
LSRFFSVARVWVSCWIFDVYFRFSFMCNSCAAVRDGFSLEIGGCYLHNIHLIRLSHMFFQLHNCCCQFWHMMWTLTRTPRPQNLKGRTRVIIPIGTWFETL